MRTLVIAIVCGVSSVAITGAEAAPPAWCKGASPGTPNLSHLSSTDVRDVLKAFVDATCAPTPEVEAHRGEIDSARQAWTKRLGMVEADWPDVIAYLAARYDHSIRVKPSTSVLSAATPIDQYAVITQVSDRARDIYADVDTFYATDLFESNLSQLGRFAFLTTSCFDTDRYPAPDSSGMLGTEARWAICQADFERLDAAKLLDEVRAETTRDGAVRMKLRVDALTIAKRIKDHAAEVQQMIKRDEANKKLFDVAASARAEWSSGIGKNTKLLELVLAMDSARFAESRKQFEGCADRTAAALADAVSTLPAKAFAGMRDQPNTPNAGFASSAGPVLGRSPAVNLAAIAFSQCTPDTPTSQYLKDILAKTPAVRGPRSAALSAVRGAKITYDKMNATPNYPEPRPYGRSHPDGTLATNSSGSFAVFKSFKRDGDMLLLEMAKVLVKQEECVKSHSTGRIHQVHSDGRVQYERVCDRTGTVVHDETLRDFKVSAKFAPWLKPGVRFSTVGDEIIAVWPNKTAQAPSMVLGGAVK